MNPTENLCSHLLESLFHILCKEKMGDHVPDVHGGNKDKDLVEKERMFAFGGGNEYIFRK